MKRVFLIAGALAALAAADRWAAKTLPPTGVSGWARAAEPAALAADPAREKLKMLEEILRSRNDNDPRLDHEFNDLSPGAKRLFRKKYREIAAEKRNERGTIVYLLGRNLRSHEDWVFLRDVALEPACLSLADCSKKPAPGSDEEATGDEITLAYPSLVALRQARRALGTSSGKEALGVIEAAKNSKTRAVARMAAAIEKKPVPAESH